MVFSKAFRQSCFPDFSAEGAYVNYKAIKHSLKSLCNELDATTPDDFFSVVEEELKRVKAWCEAHIETLLRGTVKLHDVAKSNDSHVTAGSLLDAADALTFEVLRLQEARNLNMDVLQRIMNRHRRTSVLPMQERWEELIQKHNFADLPLDRLWYHLAGTYSYARGDHIASKQQMGKGDVGSQAFDRRSVKYWVHPQDLPFVIARIIKHLPISAFKDTYPECESRGIPYEIASQISSVYFDNAQFLCYHRRQERLEGSTLFRIRWYSEFDAADANVVKPESDVFIEMKVHHETWSGDRSAKRRFSLKAKDVDGYLTERLPLTPYVAKMREKKRSEKEIGQFKSLAVEILSKVHAFKLRPVLRTQYKRVAFQLGNDASIRVSIDTQLRMSTEDFGVSKHWRTVDLRHMGHTQIPFAVVEIKLQCASNERVPNWVEELMQCRFMESVPKFSKYGHGIAELYGHTNRVHMLPYWVGQIHTDIRASTKPDSALDLTAGLAENWSQKASDTIVFHKPTTPGIATRRDYSFLPDKLTPRMIGDVARFTGKSVDPSWLDEMTSMSLEVRHVSYDEMNVWGQRNGESMASGLLAASVSCIPYLLSGGSDGGRNPTAFALANHRHHHDHQRVVHSYNGAIPWQTGKRIRVPQKFDPKTFVTSERYFLQWVQIGVHVAIIGLLLIHVGHGWSLFGRGLDHESTFGRWNVILGASFVVVSLAAMLYALIALHARELRLFARMKLRYDDAKGPVTMTVLIGVALLVVSANLVMDRFAVVLGLEEW